MDKLINRIVKRITADILDRSGLGNEMEQIDSAVRREMFKAWRGIIREELERADKLREQ